MEECLRPNTSGGGCIAHKFADGIRVNGLHRYANDREMGLTQAARAREMFADAKRDGKDITAVPGKRRAHEVRTGPGQWRKT